MARLITLACMAVLATLLVAGCSSAGDPAGTADTDGSGAAASSSANGTSEGSGKAETPKSAASSGSTEVDGEAGGSATDSGAAGGAAADGGAADGGVTSEHGASGESAAAGQDSAGAADNAAAGQASAGAVDFEEDTQCPRASDIDTITLTVNGTTFTAKLADNNAARALAELAQDGPLVLSLREYGGFEKVGPLGASLPTSDEQITAQPGDIVLYQGNQVSLFYGQNSWSYTMLAHIDATAEELRSVLGDGDVEVTFAA